MRDILLGRAIDLRPIQLQHRLPLFYRPVALIAGHAANSPSVELIHVLQCETEARCAST